MNAFDAMNVVGLLAFAVAGALKAVDADLDLLGVTVLGVVTALGGGVTRDLLVGAVPTALRSTGDVGVALVGVALALVLAQFGSRVVRSAILLPDAVGLSAFATTGALVGLGAGVSPFGVVLLAAVTGVGGGVIADLFLQTVPTVSHEDFYATCAVVGGSVFWLAVSRGVPTDASAVACAGAVLGLRLVAIRYGWRLPTVGGTSRKSGHNR